MFEPLTMLPGVSAAEEWAFIFAFIFMGLDFLTGMAGACIKHEFESSKVREGLGHKLMIAFVIALAFLIQQASGVVGDLGFDVPLMAPVCVIVIVMEVGSVLENVADTYPELRDSKLFSLFKREDEND